ncbi:cysteine-rich RLK (RECEPTOR-like protein kinase) 8 [Hibiscus trionum]|uniref:Cysteine-rich RLK (RECEPTOR-like protein kinase) 8 n=1 Tax=Hibiscus trionum TaxID=183268 RepID=A0A9W7J1M2_HIBTR|nr:cysteine-rich RLK (RECEPTOR-like protein kinase) 8 [Hibiscus trionum]
MDVARSSEGLVINQMKYVLYLLNEAGMLGCEPADTPIEVSLKFTKETCTLVDKERFQRLVGKLIYLSLTRPDIAFPVNVISQHMTNPNEKHMTAANRILRYLKKTPEHGLLFKKTQDRTVRIFTDSSWAGELTDRRSTSGYCAFVWENLVTWRSKKQSVVSRSSAEVEFRALALGMCEGIWLLKLLKELHTNQEDKFEVLCDNQSAIQITKNPVQHDRTKHVEIDKHFIAEKIVNGIATLSYIPTGGQLADILTKALSKTIFDDFLSKLGLYNVYSPT